MKNTTVGRNRENVTITLQKQRERTITIEFFGGFFGGWQPMLRCITATYYDKARTERNGNDLRVAVLFTQYYVYY